jgi:hypothetical protein
MFQPYDSCHYSDLPHLIALNATYCCVWFIEQRRQLQTSYNFNDKLMKCGYRGSVESCMYLVLKKTKHSEKNVAPLRPLQIQHGLAWNEPESPQWEACDWAMAQPACSVDKGASDLWCCVLWQFPVCCLNCKFGILLKQPFPVVIMSSIQTAMRVMVTWSYSLQLLTPWTVTKQAVKVKVSQYLMFLCKWGSSGVNNVYLHFLFSEYILNCSSKYAVL